jgi:hypothetical protein
MAVMACDPGGGFPKAKAGCPDLEPETGWLKLAHGKRVLRPFRTLSNDSDGQAYAEARGLDFPFPNDYFDAPHGSAHEVQLEPNTVCTGMILVGYREPLEDHIVPCATLDYVAGQRAVPVAIWRAGQRVVQVSELYRP